MTASTTAYGAMLTKALVNSLPESATAIVNHRIAIQDSVEDVKDAYISLLVPWAENWKFKINAFGYRRPGKNVTSHCNDITDGGDLTLTAQYELEPSPVSDPEDPRFSWLTGTIRGVFGDTVVVAPELLSG